ncbi:MAG: ribosome silencing factor [Clostridiales bacterium]|nr:ribosome silencing factor [Clostridiales bacterium]
MRMNITLTEINKVENKEFTQKICGLLKDHKGEDVVSIKVTEKTDVADYFIVAGGRSSTHARSLAEHVEEEAEKLGFTAIRKEGIKEGRWAVLDYGDVIVHIFNDETRLFYHLEKLWDDGTNTVKY